MEPTTTLDEHKASALNLYTTVNERIRYWVRDVEGGFVLDSKKMTKFYHDGKRGRPMEAKHYLSPFWYRRELHDITSDERLGGRRFFRFSIHQEHVGREFKNFKFLNSSGLINRIETSKSLRQDLLNWAGEQGSAGLELVFSRVRELGGFLASNSRNFNFQISEEMEEEISTLMSEKPTSDLLAANRSPSGIIYTMRDLLELILNKGLTVRATGKILEISPSTVSIFFSKIIKGEVGLEAPIHKSRKKPFNHERALEILKEKWMKSGTMGKSRKEVIELLRKKMPELKSISDKTIQRRLSKDMKVKNYRIKSIGAKSSA